MDLKEAEKMAWSEMLRHNLKDWDFQFNDRRTCFGLCSYYKKTIYLSRYLVELNTPARVMNTIKHEIAHALLGPAHGHNETWKKLAVQIGCDGNRCYSEVNTVIPKPLYEYVYEIDFDNDRFQGTHFSQISTEWICEINNRNVH